VREVAASAAIALQLKSIRSVGWSSFFTNIPRNEENEARLRGDTEQENDEEGNLTDIEVDMKTTIWVRRTNEKIMVRRRPW
jgi:hypothetical protein